MNTTVREIDIPTDPRERAIWVLGQLKLRGESFSALSKSHGKSRNWARQAMFQASAEAERAIATAIDLTPRDLFPERYDASGRRLHQVRWAAA
ncbi:MAG: helix-turn-helix domain-containing protein [Parvibaculum sp.]|uniref:helix-turn-helix domain-containing protein n=1 Tax=Parvibaculum sp. TaxID=2024848 RepID=UPI00271E54CA|nr:helix-turn-helix domain-containing protein [Parvibaculum sp.]MDO8837977.1 helix-turn-helix domain-containing protein [Parvibaculum sp.]